MFKDLFNNLGKLYTEQRELAAIWLETPVQTATERTVRITVGHLVKIENGELVNCTGEPTHKVIGCLGTLTSRFEIICTDLKTNEPTTVKL